MGIGQVLAAIKFVGSYQVARFALVEDSLHVDKTRLGEVELDTCTAQFLIKHRDIETVAVEAGDVTAGEYIGEVFGHLLERRA